MTLIDSDSQGPSRENYFDKYLQVFMEKNRMPKNSITGKFFINILQDITEEILGRVTIKCRF